MFKRFVPCFMLGGVLILVASCTTRNEPKVESPDKVTPVVKETPAAEPDPREITVHVDGMSEQLKLI